MDLSRLRNLSIVAHVDHGKSTLADRLLELCGAVDPRDMRAQYLDSMDIERERGITIKLQSVRLDYRDHVINLIDTPGPRGLRLRGVPVAGRLRGRDPARRRRPGHRGPDPRQLLPRPRERPRDRRLPQQARPARRRPRPLRVRDRAGARHRRPRTSCGSAPRPATGVPELLDAVIEHIPAPTGDPKDPLQALIFDSYYDSYRGVVSSVRVMTGTLKTGSRLQVHAGRRHPRRRRDRRAPTRPHAGRRAGSRRDRLPHRRHQGRARGPLRRDGHRRRPPGHRAARGLPRAQADGVLRALPDRRRPVLRPARRPREAPPQRRLLHLRAGDLRRPRLRLPLRLPRAAPHGDHPGAARARVQPRPHRHRAVGRVPGAQDRRRGDRGGEPVGAARGGEHRVHRGADAHVHDPHAEGLHGHDHGALPEPAGRDEQARVPVARAGGAHLQGPARRGGARLLRPAEEPHAGLRVARLRPGRATSEPTW